MRAVVVTDEMVERALKAQVRARDAGVDAPELMTAILEAALAPPEPEIPVSPAMVRAGMLLPDVPGNITGAMFKRIYRAMELRRREETPHGMRRAGDPR